MTASALQVAALYDVHGNLPALEAVLDELEREAPDLIVIGGDVALGPMPRETLDRLLALEGARFIRGNTDRELVDLLDGTSTLRDTADPDNVWFCRFEWVARQLTEERRHVLASFPETLAFEIDGLGPTLFCHGSPRSDEEAITALTAGAALDEMLAETAERIVVCGHTHVQFDRAHRDKRVVNAGSVGLPGEAQPGAYWLLLGPGVEPRRTAYDLGAAARRIRATGFPDPEELLARLGAGGAR